MPQLNVDENLKNSTIEKLRKNLNTSNIFENISEISKQDINFIDRGVKTSIFESENNRNSKSHVNENDLIKERIQRKEKNRKGKNRLDFNNYESMREKDINNNKNSLMKPDCQSKRDKYNLSIYVFLFTIFIFAYLIIMMISKCVDLHFNYSCSNDSSNKKNSLDPHNEESYVSSSLKISRAKELGESIFQVIF